MRLLLLLAAVVGMALAPMAAESASAKKYAPGQRQMYPGQAKKFAPGQRQVTPGQAKKFAPGQQTH